MNKNKKCTKENVSFCAFFILQYGVGVFPIKFEAHILILRDFF